MKRFASHESWNLSRHGKLISKLYRFLNSFAIKSLEAQMGICKGKKEQFTHFSQRTWPNQVKLLVFSGILPPSFTLPDKPPPKLQFATKKFRDVHILLVNVVKLHKSQTSGIIFPARNNKHEGEKCSQNPFYEQNQSFFGNIHKLFTITNKSKNQ